ncbi:hypothetical protein SKAU_G00154570 [Synaphobranchus kaupii]|uniref:MBD domain-containing protein n=1 Tax=Synaphobranchus kaupii TaxID=118154 RepID=A0A9Q1FHR5_SYNKA|nr:hypothetical protein SKAU_G00154570 [Synaphobranchus kaupii]
MTGGSERGAGDRDGPNTTAQVPIGWRRTVESGAVAYISPSGTILSSVEEVGSYLLTDGTCKCGLECPLVVHKVFNFDPGAVSLQRSQPPGKAEEDMTKLCNHRRKVVAMAALCRSMQASQLPLAAHGAGGPFCTVESRDLRMGPLGAREEGGWGSYSPRPRPSSQPKLSPSPTPPHPPLSFPFNGSLPLSRPNSNSSSRLSPRKLPPPSPSRSPFSCYGPPQSPKSRLEGMLQQYKDSGSGAPPASPLPHPQHAAAQSNQSNFQLAQNHLVPPPPPPFPSDRKNAQAANANAGFLGQLLSQQKQQHASSFPASSLLSAAAKAQLASRKKQSPSGGANAKEAQRSKVLISTLHSNARSTTPTTHALLIPHSSSSCTSSSCTTTSSSSSPRAPRPILDKAAAHRKRHRRSPTVLSMLKESQLNSLRVAAGEPSSSSSSTSVLLHPHPENHLQPSLAPSLPSKQPADAQDSKRAPAQPLSALLHLLSVQSAQASASAQAGPAPSPASSSPGPSLTLPAHHQAPPTSLAAHQQPQSFAAAPERPARLPSPQAFPPVVAVAEELTDGGPKLGQNPAPCPGPGPLLALGQSPGSQDMGGQILSLLGQLSSCPTSGPLEERGAEEPGGAPLHGHNVAAGTLLTLDSRESPETRLPGPCSPGAALAPPPSPGDPPGPLQLAESFPFMNQDQLLQLLSAHSGLPSLLAPPFLGSLPIGLWMGGGQTQAPPQTPPPAPPLQQNPSLLNQTPQLNILPSLLGAQGDLPVNLLGLLNAPPPPAATPSGNQAGDQGEKSGALQALLTASLLLGQQQAAALLPLAGLGQPLDLLLQQQPFPAPLPEGMSLEKAGLPDSGPGLLEALQSLLLPPPPAFLSLSPALLAAALGLPDPPTSQQPLAPHPSQAPTQVTLSSSALGSTSVSCASLIPSPSPDVADALTTMSGQGKANALSPHLLPPLLAPGVLSDLAALGNISSLHSLMGGGPLLLPPMQAPGLAMPLNPLTCLLNNLQLNMSPALSMGGEKPIGMHEVTSPAPQDNISANQLAQEPVSNPSHALGPQPQREGAPGGLLDPYSSFMDTIYTSFLQVSGRSPEGSGASPPTPPSFPGDPPQNSAPPSLSPRRACSLRNPDLSRLGMEAAQSPARGTPKLSEDSSSTPPPLSQRSEPPAPPAFPEEAKTDCGSAHPYSNGLLSEGEGQGQGEGPQGYHGPPEGVNGTAENHMGPEDTQGERGPTVRIGGARRGRKRKQVLPRGPDGSRETETGVSEETMASMVLQKPERSVKSKRRRVFR